MKNKLSKFLLAFSMLFTLFAIPKVEVKANEMQVQPFAVVRQINGSQSYSKEYAGETINYTVTVTGSYTVNNGTATNINANASVSRTPAGSVLSAYIKKVEKFAVDGGVRIEVTVGFKFGLVELSGGKVLKFYA